MNLASPDADKKRNSTTVGVNGRIPQTHQSLNGFDHNLQEQEVGAIFLGSVATPMSILNQTGEIAGVIQDSGIFLTESGEARTVHQVNLASEIA